MCVPSSNHAAACRPDVPNRAPARRKYPGIQNSVPLQSRKLNPFAVQFDQVGKGTGADPPPVAAAGQGTAPAGRLKKFPSRGFMLNCQCGAGAML